jgi:hypothetical protein
MRYPLNTRLNNFCVQKDKQETCRRVVDPGCLYMMAEQRGEKLW